ncbi:hypothetical protein [Rickettsia endosymbiont of Cantharis rufa]|uniref:hypothetical protein n=1 Tax=Rickettsia endosymbiont of Cantharis rufa TaxID=3066248 RepID=UPI003132FAF4
MKHYNLNYRPKNYNNFVDIEAITWNRFLVKYQKLFNNLSEEHSEILSSICSDKDGFVKLLLSDSCHLSLNKRNEIIAYLIGKYKNDTKSICYIIEQLLNICNDNTSIKTIETKVKHLNKYIKHSRSWNGLPSY